MGFGNPPGLSNPNEKKVELAHSSHGTAGTAPTTTHGANSYLADLNPDNFMPWDDANSGLDGLMDFDFLDDPKPDATNSYLGCGTPSVNNFLSRDDTTSRSGSFMDFDFFADPMTDTTNAFVGHRTSALLPVNDYIPQDLSLLHSRHNVDARNSNPRPGTLNRPNASSPLLGVVGTSSNASRIKNSAGGIMTDSATLNPFPAHGRTGFLEVSDLQFGSFPSSSSYWDSPVLAPEHLSMPVNAAYFAGQSNLNQHHNFSGQHGNSSAPFSAGSSSNSVYDWRMGRPSVNSRPGQASHHNVGCTAASQISLLSPEFTFPLAHGNALQSTIGDTFHNRTRINPSDYATARGSQGQPSHHNVGSTAASQISLLSPEFTFPLAHGNTLQSTIGDTFHNRTGINPSDYATARGFQVRPPAPLAAQINHFRPSQAAGQQQHGIRPPLPMNQRVPPFHTVPRLNIGGFQASPRLNHQSLKRPATENSHISTSSQRRRAIPPPLHCPRPKSHQTPVPPRAPVPATTPIPPASFHIKCQGFDKLPPPSGQKCTLCKRDVSFTAEGQLYQPAIPPAVAVLPCGHVFHDQCLQKITPADQSNNPPCIPCAIGET